MSTSDESLQRLGKLAFLRKSQSGALGQATDPTVILIFAWMGARIPHILKYCKAYDGLFPQATQIIVQCDPSFFYTSVASQDAAIRPVVQALDLLGCLPPAAKPSTLVKAAGIEPVVPYPTPRVLVHSFSNGGSCQLAILSKLLAARITTQYYTSLPSASLPTTAYILDSCPGQGGYKETVRAFSTAIRHPFLRFLVVLFLRAAFFRQNVIDFFRNLFGLPKSLNYLQSVLSQLQNPQLLPWFSKHTKRLYIYSAVDELIPWQEVEEHAAEGKSLGYDVKLEKFEDSGHVQHARMHPGQYWAAVKSLWENASNAKLD